MHVPVNAAFLSVKQFSERLGLSEATTRKWISSGKLAAVKVGDKSVRVPSSELSRIVRAVLVTTGK